MKWLWLAWILVGYLGSCPQEALDYEYWGKRSWKALYLYLQEGKVPDDLERKWLLKVIWSEFIDWWNCLIFFFLRESMRLMRIKQSISIEHSNEFIKIILPFFFTLFEWEKRWIRTTVFSSDVCPVWFIFLWSFLTRRFQSFYFLSFLEFVCLFVFNRNKRSFPIFLLNN